MEPERRNTKETSSLSQSRKGPKTCYGATRNPENPADYKLITHDLTLFDTLQGLAIKYGVTVSILFSRSFILTFNNVIDFGIFKMHSEPV